MQRNTLFVFILLALGLGAYVYFYEIQGADERQAAQDAEKQLFKVNKDDVTALKIQNAHGAFELSHAGSDWQLLSPVKAPADATAAEDVLYGIDALRYSKVVEEKPADLTPFGLATPRFKISFTTKDGEKALLIGDDAPFGGETYLKKEDSPQVYLSSYPLKAKVDKDLLGWRNKKILEFGVPDIQRLTVQGTGIPGFDAVRQGDAWVAADSSGQPATPRLRLDTGLVEGVLYDLQGMTTQSFTGQTDPSLFGLQPPAVTVTLELGADKARKQVFFGAPFGEKGSLPVIREPGDEVRLVDAGLHDKLGKSTADLRARTVLDLKRFKLSRLEAAVGDQSVTASRDKDSWKLEGPLKDKVQPSDIEAILDDVTQLRAETLIDQVNVEELPRYGLDKPELTLSIQEEGAAQPTRLTLSQVPGDPEPQVYARVDGDPTIYKLTRYVLEDIRDVLLKPKKGAASPGDAKAGASSGDVSGPGTADTSSGDLGKDLLHPPSQPGNP